MLQTWWISAQAYMDPEACRDRDREGTPSLLIRTANIEKHTLTMVRLFADIGGLSQESRCADQ